MASSQIRNGFQAVVPFLSVQRAASLVQFLSAALGAERTFQSKSGTHIEVKIGDSMLMIGDVGDRPPSMGQLFMYVEDVDALYQRAIGAGATPLIEPTVRNWGEDEEPLLGPAVKDPAGNSWYFAGPQ